MSSLRIAHDSVSKFITMALQAHSASTADPEAYMSIPDLATAIGGKNDAVETAVRKMDNVALVAGEKAKEANNAKGYAFTLVARKGKEKGYFPGVRLMDEAEAAGVAQRKTREAACADIIDAALSHLWPDVEVRFNSEGAIVITLPPIVNETFNDKGEVATSNTSYPLDAILA